MPLPAAATPYAQFFTSASQQYGVPVEILAAVASQESNFGQASNTYIPNTNGELGIMQTTPAIVSQYGIDPYNPQSDINGAAAYLASLYQQSGSWSSAVASYNGTGPAAAAYSQSVMSKAQSYGYAGATTPQGIGQQIGNAVTTILQGAGLQPLNQSNLGTNVGTTAAQGVGQWLQTNGLLVLGLGAAAVIGIMAVASAFSGGGGGSKTTVVPVPV